MEVMNQVAGEGGLSQNRSHIELKAGPQKACCDYGDAKHGTAASGVCLVHWLLREAQRTCARVSPVC